MATTIPRTPWIDDDGSGTTGTVLNNAIKTELYDQIDVGLAGVEAALVEDVVTSSTTGVQNAWNPGGAGPTFVAWYAASGDLTINGMVGGVIGRRVTIRNNAAGVVYVNHNNAAGVADGHLLNPATSAATPIASNGYATYIYDGTYWILVAHEQGAWITAPFSAANFTANVGTWTVEAADVTTCRYRLSGRTLTIAIFINTSSTAGGPNNLQIGNGAWGGFTINDINVPARFATRAAVCSETGAGGTYIDGQLNGYTNLVYFVKTTTAPWAAATNLVLVNGQITVEVN